MNNVIGKLVEVLERLTRKVSNSYKEAYGDYELGRKATERIENLKEYNKQEFIARMATCYAIQKKEEGLLVLPELAFRAGEEMFIRAKLNGDLDEMNKLKEREE